MAARPMITPIARPVGANFPPDWGWLLGLLDVGTEPAPALADGDEDDGLLEEVGVDEEVGVEVGVGVEEDVDVGIGSTALYTCELLYVPPPYTEA